MKIGLSILTLLFIISSSFGQEIQNDTLNKRHQIISVATVGIEGMACQEGCADKIALNLKNTPGVLSAKVSYNKKEALIAFDQNVLSSSEVKAVITNTKVKEYVYTINSMTIKE